MPLRTFTIFVACVIVLSGCARVSESRLNPLNWFGSSSETEIAQGTVEQSDPRPLVTSVTALVIERTPTGAIIRATGLPPYQGWYAGDLVPETDGPVDGVLSYRFRAVPPLDKTLVSTVRSRELTVAASISQNELAQTRIVRVIGASNIRTARR